MMKVFWKVVVLAAERAAEIEAQAVAREAVAALDGAIDRAVSRSVNAAARTAPSEAREWLPIEVEEAAETAAWFETQRRAYRNPRSREQRGREWAVRMALNRFEEPKHAHQTVVRVDRNGAATWEWRTHKDGNKQRKRDEDAHEEKISRRSGRKSRQKWGTEVNHSSEDERYVLWALEQTLHWDTDWHKIESHPLDPQGVYRLKDGRTVRTG